MESQPKDTVFSKNRTLRLGEKLIILDRPLVMGILNLSSDSFYSPLHPGKNDDPHWFIAAVENMRAWCDIIDVGAVSTRPGSKAVPEEEELRIIRQAFPVLTRNFPELSFSIDTYHAKVAASAAESGACLVNDISGGTLDPDLTDTVARLKLPYVYSHILGTPETMQINPSYQNVVKDLLQFFAVGLEKLRNKGIADIIIDPGFGFGKTLEHNYLILRHLNEFQFFQCPILAGLSRKSMIQKALQTSPGESLNGTTVLNTVALLNGADILRVHDPREAKEAVILTEKLKTV
ncbi:MAG: dihydropteroate synthase [Bacteroidales bacterium]